MGELPSSISSVPLVRVIVHKSDFVLAYFVQKKKNLKQIRIILHFHFAFHNPRRLFLLFPPIMMQLKQRVSLLGLDNVSTSHIATRHLGQNATDAARNFCLSHEGLKMEPYYSKCVVAISQGLALESEVSDDELPDLRLM